MVGDACDILSVLTYIDSVVSTDMLSWSVMFCSVSCMSYALAHLYVCVWQTFTLADFHSHHDVRRAIQRRDSVSHLTSYRGSVMEEDRRLAMFGWNLEALNMIILPMVYHKYVITRLAVKVFYDVFDWPWNVVKLLQTLTPKYSEFLLNG